MNSERIKQKIADILFVDSIDGLLWNYKPKNFREGDKIICVEGCKNHCVGEEVIEGNIYTAHNYYKGNYYKKNYLTVKEGKGVKWNDDHFELSLENKIEDVGYRDITNQKLLDT